MEPKSKSFLVDGGGGETLDPQGQERGAGRPAEGRRGLGGCHVWGSLGRGRCAPDGPL